MIKYLRKFSVIMLVLPYIFAAHPLRAEGSAWYDSLNSPSFLGSGSDYTSQATPFGSRINPAAGGWEQRTTLGLNYIALFGDNTQSSFGHAVNAGLSYPSKAGVFTAQLDLKTSPLFRELNLGTQIGSSGYFAKELYPGFTVGAGLNLAFGDGWAASLDLGLIHRIESWGNLSHVTYGIVLKQLGYSSFPGDYAAPLQIGGGLSFHALEGETVGLSVNTGLTVPLFSDGTWSPNLLAQAGTRLTLFDRLDMSFASRFDLREVLGGDYTAFLPQFSIAYRLDLSFEEGDGFLAQRGWNRSDLTIESGAAPMSNGLWAAGAGFTANLGVIDREAPVIEIKIEPLDFSESLPEDKGLPETKEGSDKNGNDGGDVSFSKSKQAKTAGKVYRRVNDEGDKAAPSDSGYPIAAYISPNNDGVSDELSVPLSLSDSRYIQGYRMVIRDSQGRDIAIKKNKELRPENEEFSFSSLWKRLTEVRRNVEIPEYLIWDGRTDQGAVAPDGEYTFFVEAWDDNGNRGRSGFYRVIVDNTPPEITIENPEDLIFSPNGDGNKDSLSIVQTGSEEDNWKGSILSADGSVRRTFTWKGAEPEEFVWNGKNDNGFLVPDGVYQYRITAIDRAGNSAEEVLDNIIINTELTPISLTIDKAFLAPGNDGSINSVSIKPEIPVKSGIDSWTLAVTDSQGRDVITRQGESDPPGPFLFNGRASGGKVLPEGVYKARLSIIYKNGNNPSAVSPGITIDSTYPEAGVTLSSSIFSPNGDGNKDTIQIYQNTSSEEEWIGILEDIDGNPIRRFRWFGKAPGQISWDGYTEEGNLAPDGSYVYTLTATDKAGNTGASNPAEIVLDTEEIDLILAVSPAAFSPNGDGVSDSVTLTPQVKKREALEGYRLELTRDGKVVKGFEGEGSVPEQFIWRGITEDGKRADDGTYRGRLTLRYRRGDVVESETRPFILDNSAPRAEISVDYPVFSPEGDGNQDIVTIEQSSTLESIWEGRIVDGDDNLIRGYRWEGSISTIFWDGTDEEGNPVPDGTYYYQVSSRDQAGNSTTVSGPELRIDTRKTPIYLTAEEHGFTPDGDGIDDELTFNTMVLLKEGIEEWVFTLEKSNGEVIKRFSGDRAPEKIIWDGSDERGLTADGTYNARFRVSYTKGNRPEELMTGIVIDTLPPETAVNLQPVPFSPDNDGVDDELNIQIDVSDASPIREWSLEIVDREGNPFQSFGSEGKPAPTLSWNGVGRNGETVIAAEEYPYRLTVSDIYGNTSQEIGIIPVDVLVVRDGDRLKIQISSITFAPNSARLRTDDPEIKEKNLQVLVRLAEILRKYRNYRILIEGHAVSVYWNDPDRARQEEQEELQPLSLERARTVLNALADAGINASRMRARGLGGTRPVVPHSDLENRWKNRRVEFILEK